MTTQEKRPLSLFEAIVPIASLVVFVGWSFFLFGDEGASGPNQVALVFATMIAVAVARRRGYSLQELGEAASASVASGIGAISSSSPSVPSSAPGRSAAP